MEGEVKRRFGTVPCGRTFAVRGSTDSRSTISAATSEGRRARNFQRWLKRLPNVQCWSFLRVYFAVRHWLRGPRVSETLSESLTATAIIQVVLYSAPPA